MVIKTADMDVDPGKLGYFGNVFLREFKLGLKEYNLGHTHEYDHVTLLAQGKVQVEIQGHEPKIFEAPTYIVIDKNLRHRFLSLAENTVYYCIFALRNADGEVIEDIYSADHDPRSEIDPKSIKNRITPLPPPTMG
jgi:hypothetical protein